MIPESISLYYSSQSEHRSELQRNCTNHNGRIRFQDSGKFVPISHLCQYFQQGLAKEEGSGRMDLKKGGRRGFEESRICTTINLGSGNQCTMIAKTIDWNRKLNSQPCESEQIASITNNVIINTDCHHDNHHFHGHDDTHHHHHHPFITVGNIAS